MRTVLHKAGFATKTSDKARGCNLTDLLYLDMTNSFKEVVLKARDSILNLQIHSFKLMSVIQIISLAELKGKNCARMSSGGG